MNSHSLVSLGHDFNLVYKCIDIFLSFISSAELKHDNTIKIITQSMVYVELNQAPILHPDY